MNSGGDSSDAQPSVAEHARLVELALAAASEVAVEPTSQVPFQSRGRVLIIGERDDALAFAAGLHSDDLSCCVLDPGVVQSPGEFSLPVFFAGGRAISVEGHFGAFAVKLETGAGQIDLAEVLDREQRAFDLVVDLNPAPLLPYQLLPLGYYAPGSSPIARKRVHGELPEMLGEFSKPKYFQYDPEICAHGNSGLSGCNRCLDACPTGAITSLVDRIQVDPHYCQGGGSCASACPTGAIIYAYPRPRDLLNRLRTLLGVFRDHGGGRPMLLFHDGDSGRRLVDEAGDGLPPALIPLEVEELGSIGPEVWLASLCYGAGQVVLLDVPTVPQSVRQELDDQLQFVWAVLSGMGYPPMVVQRIEQLSMLVDTDVPVMPPIAAAGFAGSNAKRDVLFLAVDHLLSQSDCPQSALPLPDTAPIGEVVVDREACTLCMACVSVCPASALGDGVDRPLLSFIERNCVQCGLCQRACPESAIGLNPRLLADRSTRNATRVLNEEPPFCCIVCATPFATRSVIERMTAKLADHSMFQDAAALRRLQMCGDCRVKDMFAADLKDGDR